jgi:uncharacterized membrane-anchored protein YitT (DUF2179 family)
MEELRKNDCGELYQTIDGIKVYKLQTEEILVLILEQLKGKKFKKLKGDEWKN